MRMRAHACATRQTVATPRLRLGGDSEWWFNMLGLMFRGGGHLGRVES